jgi:hypothetical protein
MKTFIYFQLISILIIKNSSCDDDENSRWLYSCVVGECEKALAKCIDINCFGEQQCIACMSDYSYSCEQCVHKIFSKSNTQKGQEIIICDENDSLHKQVCQLYCQGKHLISSECKRNENNVPVCLCKNSKKLTATTFTETTAEAIESTVEATEITAEVTTTIVEATTTTAEAIKTTVEATEITAEATTTIVEATETTAEATTTIVEATETTVGTTKSVTAKTTTTTKKEDVFVCKSIFII